MRERVKQRRIKGLNRKVFKKNLLKVLNDFERELIKSYPDIFKVWIREYEEYCFLTGHTGTFEVEGLITRSGHPEVIYTR